MEKINEENTTDFKEIADKGRSIYKSIREHLSPDYRKKYNIRRIAGCFFMFVLLQLILQLAFWRSIQYNSSINTTIAVCALIWTIIAWVFWHYSFWSYQNGVIDNISRGIIHIGSIWGVIGKLVLQYFLVLAWIAFISPISGILTWRKAVKNEKILFVNNPRDDVWK